MLIGLFAILIGGPAAQAQIKVTPSQIANLTYQLDCVAQVDNLCSEQNVRTVWEKEFLKNSLDRDLLASWGEIRKRYNGFVDVNSKPAAFSRSSQKVRLADKLKLAGLSSQSNDDYVRKLDLLVTPEDRTTLNLIVRHFSPRFAKWWKLQANRKSQTYTAQLRKILKRKDMQKLVAQMAAFYEVQPGSITLHPLYTPGATFERLSLRRIEGSAFAIEFRAGQDPKEHVGALLHEISRHFAATSSTLKYQAFLEQFEPGSVSVLNILPSAVSSAFAALGYRLLEKKAQWLTRLETPLSFAPDQPTDLAAKALLPLLEEASKPTLYNPVFVSSAIARLKAEMASELDRPLLQLKDMVLIADESVDAILRAKIRDLFHSETDLGSGEALGERSFESLSKYPRVNALILIRPEQIPLLKTHSVLSELMTAKLKTSLDEKGRAVFMQPRTGTAAIYIVVAQTPDETLEALKVLADAKAPFSDSLPLPVVRPPQIASH